VRKRPDNPNLFEIYDWKSRIVSIEGPISRFNGDYLRADGENPDVMLRSVNLSCIQNLRAMGIDYDHETYQDDPAICEGFYEAEGDTWPLKMQWYEDDDGSALARGRVHDAAGGARHLLQRVRLRAERQRRQVRRRRLGRGAHACQRHHV
jgi:hypothetical protein